MPQPYREHASTSGAAPDPNPTPLDLILKHMRMRDVKGDVEGALALARIAAPYIHPRVVATTPHSDIAHVSDADLLDADLDFTATPG